MASPEKRKRDDSTATSSKPGWGIVIGAFVLGAALMFIVMNGRGGVSSTTSVGLPNEMLAMTATAIIQEATAQSLGQTEMDPYMLTATQIITEVTATAQAASSGGG